MNIKVGQFIRTKHNAILHIIEYSDFLDEFKVRCHHREIWVKNLQEQVDIIENEVYKVVKAGDLIEVNLPYDCVDTKEVVLLNGILFVLIQDKPNDYYYFKNISQVKITKIYTKQSGNYNKQWEVS